MVLKLTLKSDLGRKRWTLLAFGRHVVAPFMTFLLLPKNLRRLGSFGLLLCALAISSQGANVHTIHTLNNLQNNPQNNPQANTSAQNTGESSFYMPKFKDMIYNLKRAHFIWWIFAGIVIVLTVLSIVLPFLGIGSKKSKRRG